MCPVELKTDLRVLQRMALNNYITKDQREVQINARFIDDDIQSSLFLWGHIYCQLSRCSINETEFQSIPHISLSCDSTIRTIYKRRRNRHPLTFAATASTNLILLPTTFKSKVRNHRPFPDREWKNASFPFWNEVVFLNVILKTFSLILLLVVVLMLCVEEVAEFFIFN